MIDPSSAFNPHFDFSSSSNRAFLSLFHFIQVGHHSFDALLEFPWFNQPHNWGFWCLQLTTERFSVDHQRRRYQFGCECEANLIRNKDILVLVLSFFFGYEFQSHPIQTIATAYECPKAWADELCMLPHMPIEWLMWLPSNVDPSKYENMPLT